MSVRTEQIASLLQRALQEVINRGFADPRIRGLVSVTKVDVAPDLSEAYVSLSILPDKHTELTMHGLRHAIGKIQSDVSRRVRLRKVPRLVLRQDDSIKRLGRIEEALRRGMTDANDSGDVEEASQ